MIRVTLIAFLTASTATAQNSHGQSAGPQNMAVPLEPGQGAFAAIAEIVVILNANPDTDWSRVDIGALRQHLVDMDNLVTHAQISAEVIPNGAVFSAKLTGPERGAVQRMVPAHVPVLATETGWNSFAKVGEDEVTWTVTSSKSTEAISALGFFGLMALGGHHQSHHLSVATGQMAH